jgi:hypothetical protein
MKREFTFLGVILFIASTWAQSPEKMSYQAVVRNNSNQLVTSQNIGLQISILQGSATGSAVYVERHFPSTNANGLVTVEVGTGTVVSGSFTSIDWPGNTYYIKAETDLTGGSNYNISGTSQLLSTPYALHAKTAASLSGTPGFVPVSRTITLNGTAQDLSANRTWNVGTVTSVGLSLPNIFSLTGSPVTTSGTINVTLASQTANKVLASPDGNSGGPAFRTLVAGDVPNLDWSKITTGKPTTLSGYGITDGVNTTSNQTIGGNKTFTGKLTVTVSSSLGSEFTTSNTTGKAVYGKATSGTGYNYGGVFESESVDGCGVFGYSTKLTGVNFGVGGMSESTSGIGVAGRAASTSGSNIGVWGRSESAKSGQIDHLKPE